MTKRSELLGIAAIHSTLLALIIASISAYAIFISDKVFGLEQKAIQDATKINSIQFNRYHNGAVHKDEVFDTKKLAKELYRILTDLSFASPGDSEREFRALGIMNAIMCQYPFSNRHFKTNEGRFGSRSDPEPILFEDFDSVVRWTKAIDALTYALIGTWDFHKESLLRIFKAYAQREHVRGNITQCLELNRLSSRDLFNEASCVPVVSCQDFFSKLIEARKIMKATNYHVLQTNAYKKNLISGRTMSVIFALISFVFVCGVVLPLFRDYVRTVWLLWVPLVLYGLGYFYLVFRILRFTAG